MTEKLVPFDMVKLLDSNEAITEYLTQVLEDGDKSELMRALGYIAKAKGLTGLPQNKKPLRHTQNRLQLAQMRKMIQSGELRIAAT